MGGQNTVRNLFYGAHDESRRIRRVTIFTYDPQWDFAIYWVTVRFPGGGAIDPWPQFTSGNKVLADPASLALADSTTYAIAADGVARLVLRLGAATVGERFTVTLYDTCCESTPSVAAESGTLTTLDNQDSPAQQLTVAAVDTDIGPMAFAVYRAPPDFSRSGRDDNSGLRMVNIHAASDAGTSGTDIVLYIVRPPVVLVHGLWGSEDDWKAFTLLKNDPLRQFFTKPVDYAYRFETQVLTGTVPAYSAESRGLIKGNALGFDFAAPVVLQQITQKLMDFRLQNGAAVAQADVIAHSMGGTITRTLINLPRYATSETYGMGFVHKLITIGTPHSGSQLAADMLDDANRCFRELLAGKGNAAVASATFGIAGDYSGGARDLSPGSDALGRMQRGNGPLVPTALVAAVTTATNTATLDCTLCVPGILRSSSRLGCPSDPVVKRFTSQLWNTEFRGEQNDGVVALSSQLAGLSASPGANPVIGVIHSSGLGRLGFTGPAEQESAAIQTLMIVLLNESTNGPDFHLGLLN